MTDVLSRLNPVPIPDRDRPSPRRGGWIAGIAATEGHLRLGYWADEEFVIVAARLVNLIGDGLMVVVDGPVRSERQAWIRLDGPGTAQSVLTRVLGASWLRHGRSALRLALDEDCPEGFYEAIVERLATVTSAVPSTSAAVPGAVGATFVDGDAGADGDRTRGA